MMRLQALREINDPGAIQRLVELYRELSCYHLYTAEPQTNQQIYNLLVSPGVFYFAVFKGGEIIGLAGLTNWQPVERNIQAHIIIDGPYRRATNATEAGKLLRDWARSYLNARRIQFYTLEDNVAVHRIAEAMDFDLEGTLKKVRYKGGKFIDARVYGRVFED